MVGTTIKRPLRLKRRLKFYAVVQQFQLKFVVVNGLQRLCSMWKAAAERNGKFYHNGRGEKQYAHRLWLAYVSILAVEFTSFKCE